MTLLKTKKTDNDRLARMKQSVNNSRSLRAINLNIDANLIRDFKITAAKKEETMTEVLTRAIIEYLE